jgi:hypothetical protein
MVGLMVGQVPTGVVGGPVLTISGTLHRRRSRTHLLGYLWCLQRPVDPREDFLRGIARFRLYGPPRGYWGLLGGPYQLSLPGGALMCLPTPLDYLPHYLGGGVSGRPVLALGGNCLGILVRSLSRYHLRWLRVVPGVPLMMLNIFIVSQA